MFLQLTLGKRQNKPTVCHPERRKPRSGWRSRSFVERIAIQNQGAKAPQGSPNEFGWPSTENVTSR